MNKIALLSNFTKAINPPKEQVIYGKYLILTYLYKPPLNSPIDLNINDESIALCTYEIHVLLLRSSYSRSDLRLTITCSYIMML